LNVRTIDDAQERSRLCESILRSLPDWFGIESAIVDYVDAVAALPTFAVGDDAFLALKLHFPTAAEVYVMGVRSERHRQGLGTVLIRAAEEFLSAAEVEYLQVKTLSGSRPDPHYARTRRFYEAVGFRPLEELPELWDPSNPCLILVKHLQCR
jgi:GNAT superfamily N-acetyltransferase